MVQGNPVSTVCSLYSLDVHAHHHSQGRVTCHGKVVSVVPQTDGVQPVLHCQTAGQVNETSVEGCLGEPGSRIIEQNHRSIESLRLEKTSKIIKSNRQANTTMPAKPCPQVPYLQFF